jgi:polyketide synthase 12
VHATVADTLRTPQHLVADAGAPASRLLVLTRRAVAVGEPAASPDLAASAGWGLVRSAAAENPGRILLVDTDGTDASLSAVAAVPATGEPQVVIRDGELLAARLTAGGPPDLVPPAGQDAWRLDVTEPGSLENLALLPAPEALEPLGPGQVRLSVRASGLNFRDVLGALGMYPGGVTIGAEAAGVVLETAPDVTGLAPGDRVFGMVTGSAGPVATTDRRLLAVMPGDWTFAQAAAVPVVYLTAYYGLVDLAGVSPGQSVLVHSAAGGVGTAAVQLARHLGAEVYGTASPGKWDALRAAGLPDDHIASSRTLDFEAEFRAASSPDGLDVVLNSLAHEFLDASLRLVRPGGRFLEMGKTDVRDADAVRAAHGAEYTAFDLVEAGPDRIADMLVEVLALFDSGALTLPPVTVWDARSAPDALRHLSHGRHRGKVVLTVPRAPDPGGTVLVTGATGALGGLVARHLVSGHGVRHLVLAGRRGAEAPGMAELVADLEKSGAEDVRAVRCDVSDRASLASLLSGIPDAHPLTGVVHAAGVLDDGVLPSMTPERLRTVFAPKVDAAWLLHELTLDADLAFFSVFSSATGTLGGVGQAGYAAANAFLDALAAHRKARGLPAGSLAWGLWSEPGGMTAHLTGADLARMARAGSGALSAEEGLRLFDAAMDVDEAVVLPVKLNLEALRRSGEVPPILSALVRRAGGTPRPARASSAPERESGFAPAFADASPGGRRRLVLDLVTEHAAAVLGHAEASALGPDEAFKDMGFDSLTSVELRNRLAKETKLRLPAGLLFDHPTVQALADRLNELLTPSGPETNEPADAADAAEAAEPSRTPDIDFDALDAQSLIDLAMGGADSGTESDPDSSL